MVHETRKIMGTDLSIVVPDLRAGPRPVQPTASRSSSRRAADHPRARRASFGRAPGRDGRRRPGGAAIPPAPSARDHDDVFVGRIRADLKRPNALLFWCVSDNLRKGAATNAVQIAEVPGSRLSPSGRHTRSPAIPGSGSRGHGVTDVGRQAALEAIAAEVRVCTNCRLHETRTKAVPGEGDPETEVVVVGEGPGEHEDRQGRPFIGASGQFLTELNRAIGWQREDVFITNVVKCRPPGNRDPQPDEIAACSAFLRRELEVVDPAVVVRPASNPHSPRSGQGSGSARSTGRPRRSEPRDGRARRGGLRHVSPGLRALPGLEPSDPHRRHPAAPGGADRVEAASRAARAAAGRPDRA